MLDYESYSFSNIIVFIILGELRCFILSINVYWLSHICIQMACFIFMTLYMITKTLKNLAKPFQRLTNFELYYQTKRIRREMIELMQFLNRYPVLAEVEVTYFICLHTILASCSITELLNSNIFVITDSSLSAVSPWFFNILKVFCLASFTIGECFCVLVLHNLMAYCTFCFTKPAKNILRAMHRVIVYTRDPLNALRLSNFIEAYLNNNVKHGFKYKLSKNADIGFVNFGSFTGVSFLFPFPEFCNKQILPFLTFIVYSSVQSNYNVCSEEAVFIKNDYKAP